MGVCIYPLTLGEQDFQEDAEAGRCGVLQGLLAAMRW